MRPSRFTIKVLPQHLDLQCIHRKIAKGEDEITEAQDCDWSPNNPGLFGQQSPSHPGLRALQDRKRQLERVVEHLEGELWGQ